MPHTIKIKHVPTAAEILALETLARHATPSWEIVTKNGIAEMPPQVGYRTASGYYAVVATFPPRIWSTTDQITIDAEYVAAAHPDLILGLIARIRHLELQLTETTPQEER